MKKVLIITYYWPPAGGSGVQRWLKFTKYLKDFGVEPIIYTVDGANYPKVDESLLNEIPEGVDVLKQLITEPTDLFFWKKNKNKKKDISNAVNNPIFSFIRGNLFVPDPKISWVKPSVKYLNSYLKSNSVDIIVSTGPPHSMHLIAKEVSKANNIKWVADFRDPWTSLYYNNEFRQLSFIKKKHKKLETDVLNSADCILTVSYHLKKEFERTSSNVKVITNGFDEEVLEKTDVDLDAHFSISYIGLLPKQSNPKLLFEVLKELKSEVSGFGDDLKLNFIGDISNDVREEIKNKNLTDNANFIGYVSHKKAIEFQKKSQVLLLLIPNVSENKGIVTGKVFEYLTAKRPILAIGSEDGELATILNDTKAGFVIDFNAKEKLKAEILSFYQQFKAGNLVVTSENINQFHRKNLTQQLAELLKSM